MPATAAGAPDWLARLVPEAGFCDAVPFGTPEPAPLQPEPAEDDAAAAAAEALARAYADGEAAGRAAAAADAEHRFASQRALRLTFHALDEAALGVLAEELATTVMALVEGVLGEVAVDRAGLVARCHTAARRIGGAPDSLTLRLHPEDIALAGEAALAGWRVVPDPALARGALRIESPDGAVSEGPEEWRRAVAAAVRG